MSSQPQSRQELYDRIRESSRDEVILQEMIRLGFWPEAGVLPEDPADEIRRRGQLESQLRALRTEKARLSDVEAMRREARKRRMAESRKRREETKQRRLAEREERAQQWAKKQDEDVVYLGREVSAGLNHLEGDPERMQRHGVPPFSSPAELARAMGLPLSAVRFLAFNRSTSKVSHYVQFTIPKRSGGERLISAPLPRLKAAQHWILERILRDIPVSDQAHGFVGGRSIVSNASPHVGAGVVVNVDLKDFFPTVCYRRVRGLFRSMGYCDAVAIVLGLLCTEPRAVAVELDGEIYHVALEERVLPQGAPTSPAITNLLCRGLDARLSRVADSLGMTYTRYADDLTFSGPADTNVGRLLRQMGYIVAQEGFEVHPDKTRVLRRTGRQEVTGIVVNDKLGICRATLKRFRATLFQIEKDGPEGKRWGEGDDVIAAVEGFANYVFMVDREKGRPLQIRARALVQKHGKKPQRQKSRPAAKLTPPTSDPLVADEIVEERDGPDEPKKKKKGPWWKLW